MQVDPAFVTETCIAFELPKLLQRLDSHSVQLLVGIDLPTLRDLIGAEPTSAAVTPARPIVFLSLPQIASTEMLISTAIEQIATVASDLWPLWFGGEDFSEVKDDPLSQMYLPVKLGTLQSEFPALSSSWALAAIRQLRRGRSPRVPHTALETEWSQLCHAISPNGVIVVVTLDEIAPQRAWPLVHALEWMATKANVVMAVLCRNLPPTPSCPSRTTAAKHACRKR